MVPPLRRGTAEGGGGGGFRMMPLRLLAAQALAATSRFAGEEPVRQSLRVRIFYSAYADDIALARRRMKEMTT